jgi:phosphohistidine phosphatase
MQTSTILAETLLSQGQAQARTGLAPGDPPEQIAAESDSWTGDTVLVGHLPHLGRLAALLLAAAPDLPLPAFQPGSVACLERDGDGRWGLA